MMKITIDNYASFFNGKLEEIATLESLDNKEIQSVAKNLREKFEETLASGEERIGNNSTLKIGVVGQVKAGKSSFLNSLLFDGENVLPRASTPMTAGLTVLGYGEENKFVVEYYNTKEWATFEGRDAEYKNLIDEIRKGDSSLTEEEAVKMANLDAVYTSAHELVANCSRKAKNQIQEQSKLETKTFSTIDDLQGILEDFVGANGSYTSVVKCLTIRLNDQRLKDIQVVDTPGVNDPIVSREQRTREFLRGCHGVFFLSYSGRFFDSTDVGFLTERIGDQGIGTVVLIASKFDSVLQDVGSQFKDDLMAAIGHCQMKLKKQFETNIAASDFKGEDPLLNFSSGIGFSIYKKDPSKWDEMEKHVVNQMTRFYPSYFNDVKDAKSTFCDLANMDEIQKNYLEGVFKGNKDKIIQSTMYAFFRNANDNLSKDIDNAINRIKNRLDALTSSDLSDLKTKKELLEDVKGKIKQHIQTIANVCDTQAERYRRECMNGFTFGNSPIVPCKHQEVTVTRQSTFWGRDKSFTCSVDNIDVNQLIQKNTDALNHELSKLEKSWAKAVKELTGQLEGEMHKVITDSEKKDQTGKLDADSLRDILSEILETMMTSSTLDTAGITRRFNNQLSSQLQGVDDLPFSLGSMEESAAKQKTYNKAKKNISDARNILASMVSATVDEIENKVHPTFALVL